MTEDKTISKPRQLWEGALKAVKGKDTEQLMETFTSEMTLVAEGLCEDQNDLRREIAQVRALSEKLEHRADNEQELLETTLREERRDIDRRLDEMTHRIAAMEAKQVKETSRKDKLKGQNWIGQLTILASIIAGAWIIVTVLNLLK